MEFLKISSFSKEMIINLDILTKKGINTEMSMREKVREHDNTSLKLSKYKNIR